MVCQKIIPTALTKSNRAPATAAKKEKRDFLHFYVDRICRKEYYCAINKAKTNYIEINALKEKSILPDAAQRTGGAENPVRDGRGRTLRSSDLNGKTQ